jgi:hypothetical protein
VGGDSRRTGRQRECTLASGQLLHTRDPKTLSEVDGIGFRVRGRGEGNLGQSHLGTCSR